MESKLNILLVEDDLLSRLSLKGRLELSGRVQEASSANEALELLKTKSFDLAFVDLDLERQLAGLEIVRELREKNIHTIVLSGREEDSIIEEAYSLGCQDFLSKPFTKKAIEAVLGKYKNNKADLLSKLKATLLTEDSDLKIQLKLIEQAIFGDHPILITGETGTGKTFLAKYIHELIGVERPFVHLNCSEIAESLIESELFGHERGAFTGALKSKKDSLNLQMGDSFLDEIATLPISLQKKLLKAIEEKTFYPVGSEKAVNSSFRLISATCEDLKTKVEKGEFREDFLFRLLGFNVVLKPLRERREDLNNLINYFLKQNKRRIVLSSEVRSELLNYSWPGNVRELQKVVEILRTNEKGIIEKVDLAGLLQNGQKLVAKTKLNISQIKEMGLAAYIEKVEAEVVGLVLAENNEKVRKTLSDLKLSNNSFYRILGNIKNQESLRE